MNPTPDPRAAALRDAIALGHNLATPRLGHTASVWADCPQTLCRRVRASLDAAQPAPVLDVARLQRIEAAARVHQFTRDGHWDMSAHNHSDCTIASERALRAALAEPQS